MFNYIKYVKNYSYYKLLKIFSRKFIEKKIHNYRMLLDLNDPGISRSLALYGDREQQLGYIFRKEVQPGYKIIDLGANIGYYALMEWKLVGEHGKVYALEPSPANFDLLEKNVNLNNAQNIIDIFHLAGGAKCSKEKFYLAEYSNLNTFIPELYHSGEKSKKITENYVIVDLVDMTTFISDKGKIDLIRMDIEGYEVEVLEGLKAAIENGDFSGKIVFECHFPKYDDTKHSMRDKLKMLFDNDYFVKIMTSNNEKTTFFSEKGYKPQKLLRTGVDSVQGVYYDVSQVDAEYFICDVGGVRDVLLEKR